MLSKIHVLKFYLQRYLFFRILKKYLNLERGSVTPFGLLNDAGHVVEVFIDKGLEGAPAVGFHPNENTATVFLPMAEVIRIIQEHGNPIKFIDL